MEIIGTGGTKQERQLSGTFNGVFVNLLMQAAATNTALVASDFDPAAITLKVVTKLKGEAPIQNMNDNLRLLGSNAALRNGYHEFINGVDKVLPAVGVKHIKLRTVFIPFGGHVRIDSGEELLCECILPQNGAFGANVDKTATIVDFYFNPSVGYMRYVPIIKSEVVQANSTRQDFSLGDNVTKLMLFNFDKTDLATEVVQQLNLSSDRLDVSYTFNQLQALKAKSYPDAPMYKYVGTLPATSPVLRALDPLPQSIEIFNGMRINNELDKVRVTLALSSANVASSNNYIVWHTYESTIAMVQAANARLDKHADEKVSKMPTK